MTTRSVAPWMTFGENASRALVLYIAQVKFPLDVGMVDADDYDLLPEHLLNYELDWEDPAAGE